MTGFKNILFPADLSEVSSQIAPWVRDVAKTYDAQLHVLFVARRFQHFAEVYVELDSINSFEAEIIRGAEKKMDEFIERHFGGDEAIKRVVAIGDAAEEILAYIKDEKIDLVVMGTHGRKGLEKILFGSVAERVIKMSQAPVLSINPYRVMK